MNIQNWVIIDKIVDSIEMLNKIYFMSATLKAMPLKTSLRESYNTLLGSNFSDDLTIQPKKPDVAKVNNLKLLCLYPIVTWSGSNQVRILLPSF